MLIQINEFISILIRKFYFSLNIHIDLIEYRSFTMLVTGNSDGHILGWDVNNSSTPTLDFLAHNDCTNGVR